MAGRRGGVLVRGAALVAAVGLLMGAGGSAGPVSARAGAPGGVAPGYTVDNPPLEPLEVDGAPTRVLQGVHEGAAYAVEVPAGWNGDLVVWAHGFRGSTTVLSVVPPGYGLREHLVSRGYAWAASSYDRNGYDVGSGVRSTAALAELVAREVGEPGRTYVAGESMGGHVVARSLEEHPRLYDGGLPLCGVLGDAELFDYFLDHNLAAQALAGVRAYPVPDDYLTVTVPRIQAELGLVGLAPGGPGPTDERGVQLREVVVERSGGPRPGDDAAFAVWKDFLFGVAAGPDDGGALRDNPGRVAQNLRTDYEPDAPVDLDAVVQRVAPAAPEVRVRRLLDAVARVDGRPRVPVLSLHGLGDLFVPFSMEQVYAREAARHGRDDLVVQRAIRTAGHCEFSGAEVTTAFDDLAAWVQARETDPAAPAPAGDPVLDRAAVARPDFGCAHSDRAAHPSGTRAL